MGNIGGTRLAMCQLLTWSLLLYYSIYFWIYMNISTLKIQKNKKETLSQKLYWIHTSSTLISVVSSNPAVNSYSVVRLQGILKHSEFVPNPCCYSYFPEDSLDHMSFWEYIESKDARSTSLASYHKLEVIYFSTVLLIVHSLGPK